MNPLPLSIDALPIPDHFFRDLTLRLTLTLLIVILIITTGSRFYNLTIQSLWSDELWGVVASSQGRWINMVRNLIFEDSHPPGYQTLLYFWMTLFGRSDVAVRLPSVIAGIAAVGWTFQLGRQHFSTMTGLLAATIVSGSFHAVYYSQEARAYAFMMLLAPACSALYLDIFLRRVIQRHTLPLFWAVSTCMLYMHYAGFVFMASMLLLWLILWRQDGYKRDQLPLAKRVFLPCFLLYLPWLPVMYYHMVFAPDHWSTPEPDGGRAWKTIQFLLGPELERTFLFGFLLVGSTLHYLLRHKYSPLAGESLSHSTYTQKAFFCLAWLSLLPIAVFFIKSLLGQSVYTYRHFTYAIPLLAVMSACLPVFILQQIQVRQWRNYSLIFCLLVIFTFNMHGNTVYKVYQQSMRQDYRGAINIIRRDTTFNFNGSPKIIVSNHPFFGHYLRQYNVKDSIDLYLKDPKESSDITALLQQNRAQHFYYLEVGTRATSSITFSLMKRYELECYSRLAKVNVARFKFKTPQPKFLRSSPVHECP